MKRKVHFNRYDLALIIALVVFNLILIIKNPLNAEGSFAEIQVDQKKFARIALAQYKIIKVSGPIGITEVEIDNGRARILKSPCQKKICIKSGYIQHADRISACIPNRVLVRIVGVERNRDAVDTIVG